MNSYESAGGYTVMFQKGTVKIITKEKVDVWDGVLMLPKSLIVYILQQQLPSPLKFSVLSLNEEVGWIIDAICFSPDEKQGFLTLKGLYYLSK